MQCGQGGAVQQLAVTSVVTGGCTMSADAGEFPTLQFAESVKSFVSKCQALSINAEEYRLMKLIALFQSAGQFFTSCLFSLVSISSEILFSRGILKCNVACVLVLNSSQDFVHKTTTVTWKLDHFVVC